jgi:hypothetical protein
MLLLRNHDTIRRSLKESWIYARRGIAPPSHQVFKIMKRYRYTAVVMLMLAMVIMILIGTYRTVLHDVRSSNADHDAAHASNRPH